MDAYSLTDEIERVRTELDHRKRSRTSVERAKLHINRKIEEAQRTLDKMLQVARRAQDDVEEAQKRLDEEVQRLRTNDDSLQQIADEELELANQLRDLSHKLTRLPQPANDNDAPRTSRRYKA